MLFGVEREAGNSDAGSVNVDKGALVRAILYSVALLYLFLDLFVFKGPLQKKIKGADPQSAEAIAQERARGVAARVYFQPILLTQIDRAIEERLWRQGQAVPAFTLEELKGQRLEALNQLFNEHLLRVKVRFNHEDYTVTEEEVAAAVQSFRKKFANQKLLDEALSNQAWAGDEELVARVRAKLEQEKYLAEHIEIAVSEEEVRSYYEANRGRFVLPERVRARHIFYAALEHPNDEALRLARETKKALAEGADFAVLASEQSEDLNTKDKGGDLGWMSRKRLSEEFAEAVFSLEVSTINLVKTSLGVHVLEVMEERPARERSFEGVKAELSVVLSNQKREEGLNEYLRYLRYRDRHKLEIFDEMLERPWSLEQ